MHALSHSYIILPLSLISHSPLQNWLKPTPRRYCARVLYNKCIGDDTKAAARQSLNRIKNKKYMAKNDFQYGWWNSYTLQCGMWLWNRDSEFTKWQYPAMWYVALGWHAIEFAQTSAILEFYIWFPFLHITAVDVSFCTSLWNFIQIRPPSAEKNDVMSIFKMADLSHLEL